MIRYLLDKEQKYKDDLLKHLRAHNDQHVVDKTNDTKYIYIYKNNELVGFVCVSYGWSWAGFDNLFYTTIDVLQTLISESVKMFKDRVFGFKMYSKDIKRIEDLKQSGFIVVDTVPGTNRTGDYACLDLNDMSYNFVHENEVKIYDEEQTIKKAFIAQYNEAYRKKHDLDVLKEEILYVALDDNEFCGAVHSRVYQDYMNVHLLVVKAEYKGKGIGTKLMKLSEEYAINLKLESIDLGTTEFQAKPFYEKLGYEVVFTRDNYPQGYKCYTLYKKL